MVSVRTFRFKSIFLPLLPHCIYVFRVILYSEEPLIPYTARTHLASASILNLFTFMLRNKTNRRFRDADNSLFQTAFCTTNRLCSFVPTNDDTDVVCFALIILKWICPMRWKHSNEACKST
jgi:hypothetical protein